MTKRRTADHFRRDMAAKDKDTKKHVASTPGDIERKAIIDRQAAESLRRLDSDFTLNDWRAIHEKYRVVVEEVMAELGLVEWDGDNKKLVREITNRMEEWERSVTDRRPMTKSERWSMREFFGNPRYEQWLNQMSGARRRKMNNPASIINAYKRDVANKKKREPLRALQRRKPTKQIPDV